MMMLAESIANLSIVPTILLCLPFIVTALLPPNNNNNNNS